MSEVGPLQVDELISLRAFFQDVSGALFLGALATQPAMGAREQPKSLAAVCTHRWEG